MKTKCYRMHPWGLGELGRNSIYYSGTMEQRWPNVEGNKDIIGNRELKKKHLYFREYENKPFYFRGSREHAKLRMC